MPTVSIRGRMQVATLAALLGIAMTAALALAPTASHACSCIPPRPPQESLESADAVFAGKVLSVDKRNRIELPGENIVSSYNEVTLQVSKRWKDASDTVMTVTTSDSSAACGYSFEVGQEYLVYANEGEEGMAVSLCSRTARLADAQEDVAALGEGSAPEPTTNAPVTGTPEANEDLTPVIALSVLAIVAIAVGYALGRRAKK